MPIRDAVMLARQKELDLVEIAPTAQPPVCRIMNLGKFMYQQSKKAQQARKKQKTVLVKKLGLRRFAKRFALWSPRPVVPAIELLSGDR